MKWRTAALSPAFLPLSSGMLMLQCMARTFTTALLWCEPRLSGFADPLRAGRGHRSADAERTAGAIEALARTRRGGETWTLGKERIVDSSGTRTSSLDWPSEQGGAGFIQDSHVRFPGGLRELREVRFPGRILGCDLGSSPVVSLRTDLTVLRKRTLWGLVDVKTEEHFIRTGLDQLVFADGEPVLATSLRAGQKLLNSRLEQEEVVSVKHLTGVQAPGYTIEVACGSFFVNDILFVNTPSQQS